jgi:glycosyltransferase involved in cell wall biosynthesis
MATFLNRPPYRKAMKSAKEDAPDLAAGTLVSIIITFSKSVDLILRATTSALSQTYPNIEILLISVGSTDELGQISHLSRSDDRIRIFSEPALGVAAARNLGMQLSRGEYIAFLDSNDVFLPDKINTQLLSMQDCGSLFSHTSYFGYFPENSTKRIVIHSGRFSGFVYPDIISTCPIATSTVMLHSIIVAEGFRFHENYDLAGDVSLWATISQLHNLLGVEIPLSEIQWDRNAPAIDVEKRVLELSKILEYFRKEEIHSDYLDQIQILEEQRSMLIKSKNFRSNNAQSYILPDTFGPQVRNNSENDGVDRSGIHLDHKPDAIEATFAGIPQLWKGRGDERIFLLVTHNWGGGIERHVMDMTQLLLNEGVHVIHCRPSDNASIILTDKSDGQREPLSFNLESGAERLANVLREMAIDHVHIHSLVGYIEGSSDLFVESCASADLAFDVSIHDYMSYCPRINLIDGNTGVYCGSPGLTECERCVSLHGSPFGRPPVGEWRARSRRFLGAARYVFVPNIDVRERMERYFPGLRLTARAHPEPRRQIRRIAVIGNISPHKGSNVLLKTAQAAHHTGVPIKFIVLGSTDKDDELKAIGNVQITGQYDEDDAEYQLRSIRADLAWFPSVCPETYCYTLSVAMLAGVKCVSFDLGAIANRIRNAQAGEVIPLGLASDPLLIARELLRFCPVSFDYTPVVYPDLIKDYYGLRFKDEH